MNLNRLAYDRRFFLLIFVFLNFFGKIDTPAFLPCIAKERGSCAFTITY